MKMYYQTLHNHRDIDVSKYFISPFKSPSQLTFLFNTMRANDATMNVII